MLKCLKGKVIARHKSFRFDHVCADLFPDVSRKKIKKILDDGGAYVNKKRIQLGKHLVKPGDAVEIFWNEMSQSQKREQSVPPEELQSQYTAENIICFQNDDFFVINKPAGIPCQGTLESSRHTIISFLQQKLPAVFSKEQLKLVHRLDKDTAGLLILARNVEAQRDLELLFRERKVHKKYLAVCYGIFKVKKGSVDTPLQRDLSRPNCFMTTTKKSKFGKSAVTHYEILQESLQQDVSLVLCRPETGRTHQIRVHMASLGHPIVGDKTYSQNVLTHPMQRRYFGQLLHAHGLEFLWKGKQISLNIEFEKLEELKGIWR